MEQFGKQTKTFFMKYFCIVNIIFLQFIFSQETKYSFSRDNFCDCKIRGEKIIDIENETIKDSVFVKVNSLKDSLKISFYNTTKDTIYLFNSYFSEDISKSKFLYRINKKEKKRKISFLPLVPYLFTKYSDRIIIKNRIINDYQVVYNFDKIPPNRVYNFYIKINNVEELNLLIEDFDLASLNKFQSIKKFKSSKVKPNKDFNVEFAYYKHVDLLCNKNDYFLKEIEFNNQAKSFEIVNAKLN